MAEVTAEEGQARAEAPVLQKPVTGSKSITVHGDGRITWDGFSDLYQVMGFIDIHMNPQLLKQAIIKSAQIGPKPETQ